VPPYHQSLIYWFVIAIFVVQSPLLGKPPSPRTPVEDKTDHVIIGFLHTCALSNLHCHLQHRSHQRTIAKRRRTSTRFLHRSSGATFAPRLAARNWGRRAGGDEEEEEKNRRSGPTKVERVQRIPSGCAKDEEFFVGELTQKRKICRARVRGRVVVCNADGFDHSSCRADNRAGPAGVSSCRRKPSRWGTWRSPRRAQPSTWRVQVSPVLLNSSAGTFPPR
jgi:hypothetical protein